tara:strand:+ start:558 stop:980 length:423 start_codon:yes stop_codon:yes gene_type:complete
MMITLETGQKLKSKRTHSYFDEKINLTKIGYVWKKKVFPSLEEAEHAILLVLVTKNKKAATCAWRVRNCIPRAKALYIKSQWAHPGSDNERIWWGEDGGLAVAVKLDSLGKAIEFLSLCDWSNKYQWQLPSEVKWHYFNH